MEPGSLENLAKRIQALSLDKPQWLTALTGSKYDDKGILKRNFIWDTLPMTLRIHILDRRYRQEHRMTMYELRKEMGEFEICETKKDVWTLSQ